MNTFILNRTRHLAIIVMTFLSACLVLSSMHTNTAHAAPSQQTSGNGPTTVTFEGYLANTNGTPIPDGVKLLTFTIYDSPTATTPEHILWTDQFSVPVKRGLYTVSLGSNPLKPLTPTVFNGPRWIGIAVEANPELANRIPVAAVPWALQAEGLQGYSVSDSAPADGHALIYNSLSGKWEPKALPNTGDATSLQGNPIAGGAPLASGQSLIWDGTNWVPAWPDAGSLQGGLLGLAYGGVHADLSSTGPGWLRQASQGANITVETPNLTDLGDVSIASTPADGQALVWNNSTGKWKPGSNVSGVVLADGSVPMSGDLNLRGFSVKNAASLIVNAISASSTPAAGTGVFYEKLADKKPYFMNADGTEYGLGPVSVDVQTFATPGSYNWAKPTAGQTVCKVIVYGAGGGGGGGRSGPDGTNRRGGSGGGGGAYAEKMLLMLDLPAIVTANVGAGGAGGPAGAAGGNNGSAGSGGGASLFGFGVNGYVYAGGGGGGIGGNNTTQGSSGGGGGGTAGPGGAGASNAASIGGAPQLTAGAIGAGGAGGGSANGAGGGLTSEWGGGGGGGAIVSAGGAVGAASLRGGGGGGGGGSRTSGNSSQAGGQAGGSLYWGIGNGTYSGNNGWDGGANAGASGGGGGATFLSNGNGNPGGNGGNPGGGGGGGGGGINAGNGGNGGTGLVVVICW